MPRRILSIPLLCLLAIHAVFGGVRGATAMCFGGHSHHEHVVACDHRDHGDDVQACDEPTAASAHAASDDCPHEQTILGPVPVDLLADCCTCTDVEIDLRDLPATSRDAEDDSDPPILIGPPVAVLATCDVHAPRGLVRGPPPRETDDPARLHGLRVVRSTRFNI
jgi:hypothetical protein